MAKQHAMLFARAHLSKQLVSRVVSGQELMLPVLLRHVRQLPSTHPFSQSAPTRSLSCPLTDSVLHPLLVNSFVASFITHTLVHSCVHSFTETLTQSFFHAYIHAFICSLMKPLTSLPKAPLAYCSALANMALRIEPWDGNPSF